MKASLPFSEVDVYGSHATQLCLHWSDIDLVLIPPNGSDDRDNWSNPLRTVFLALNSEENKSWVTNAQFIDSANVPVIKLQCNFFEQF
jgi:DNA polymerase sigma